MKNSNRDRWFQPRTVFITAKVLLVLFVIYRICAAGALNIPLGVACSIHKCFVSPLPPMSSFCKAYCPVFQSFRDTYLEFDPILSTQDYRCQVVNILYAFFYTPLFVFLTLTTLADFQQRLFRKIGCVCAAMFFGLFLSLMGEEGFVSPSPFRVIGYNIIDLIGPLYMIFFFWSSWEAQRNEKEGQRHEKHHTNLGLLN